MTANIRMCAAWVIGLGALVCTSQGAVITLVEGNSVAHVDDATSAGMFNWVVDGTNQLTQQWFWYRVGSVGPESPINTISAPVTLQPDARSANTTYNNGAYSVRVAYQLTGGLAGSGVSDVAETITINNLTASALAFHFYQYSDFDLGGTTGGDIVQLGTNLQGKFSQAFQSKGAMSLTELFSDTVGTPGADRGEVGLFPTTLNKLNDGIPTDLINAAGPLGPGDATWAFQWDLNIPAGGSVIISKDKLLHIPEPSVLALAALGLSLGALRRPRQAA